MRVLQRVGLLLIGLLALPVCAVPSYVLQQPPTGENISQYFEFHRESEVKAFFADATNYAFNQWQPVLHNNPSFGYSAAPHWFSSVLTNTTDQPLDLYLEIANSTLDRIDVFIDTQPGSAPQWVMGDALPFAARAVQGPYFVAPIHLPPGASKTITLKVTTTGPLSLPLYLYSAQQYPERLQREQLTQGFFVGSCVAFLFFTLVLFAFLRVAKYFYYALIICGLLLGQITRSGLGFAYLWSDWPTINSILLPFSVGLFHIGIALLFLYLVRRKNVDEDIGIALEGYVATLVLLSVIMLFLPESTSLKIISLFITIGGGTILYNAIKLYGQGHSQLSWFVPLWAAVMGVVIVISSYEAGFFSAPFLTEAMMRWAFYPVMGLVTVRLLRDFARDYKQRQLLEAQMQEHRQAAIDEKERYLQLQLVYRAEEMAARQRIMQAETESRAKGQFLATMSHEIRTPMNGVLGITELLQNTRLNKLQQKYVDIILASGRALLSVINDILDLSKINSGRMELENVDLDLDQLCSEAITLFLTTAEQKGLQLYLEIDPATPQCISGDPVRIRQIILNLLGNALKFTGAGAVTLRVKLERPQRSGISPTLHFAVIDTGIGISEQDQQQLFEAFAQADKSTTRQYGGTGLGLSICKQLVDLMKGDIGVESYPGQGSSFWFSIPYFQAGKEFAAQHALSLESIQSCPILIIEADSVLADHIEQCSSYWNADITRCVDKDSAIKQATLTGAAIRCVVLDQVSNKKVNRDKLETLQALCPNAKTLLLAYISELPSAAVMEELHIEAVLQKPIAMRSLVKRALQASADDAATNISSNTPVSLTATSTTSVPTTSVPTTSAPTTSVPTTGAQHSSLATHSRASASAAPVLVVEDNLVNQMVVNGMLKQMGLRSVTVSNGKQALDAYCKTPQQFHCILMDCEMPEMDGYEATQRIREFEQQMKCPRVPILALTAHVLADARDQLTQAGMDAYIPKPVSQATLQQMMQEHAPAVFNSSSVA